MCHGDVRNENMVSTTSDATYEDKKRVIKFLVVWQQLAGIHFFFDPVINAFVEVG